jgi:hypothetical protein
LSVCYETSGFELQRTFIASSDCFWLIWFDRRTCCCLMIVEIDTGFIVRLFCPSLSIMSLIDREWALRLYIKAATCTQTREFIAQFSLEVTSIASAVAKEINKHWRSLHVTSSSWQTWPANIPIRNTRTNSCGWQYFEQVFVTQSKSFATSSQFTPNTLREHHSASCISPYSSLAPTTNFDPHTS